MKTYIKILAIASFVPLLFQSCLKDKEIIGPDADGSVENVVEFANIAPIASTTSSSIPLYIQSFDIVPSIDLNVPVKIAGVYNPSGDTKVVVELDNSLLDIYNEENETDYEPLPQSYFTVPAFEVIIPKGEKASNFLMKMLVTNFDFDHNYAIGLKIKSVSQGTISGNFGSIILGVAAKNALDGQYTVAGTLVDVTSPAFVHGSTRRTYTVELHTIGPDEIVLFDPYAFGTYILPFYTGTGWSGYGSFSPVFKFDKTTNKIVSVRNYYGQPAANTRSAEIDPNGVNTYNPTTKEIKVSYFMKQPSSVPAPPNIRAKVTESYKYVGAR